ncbi:MAG: aminotransferase class I/II-fold pyridoxal phosphate-dependent enzyme [Candidatus Latescibacteria bacterium]|nr:aminotransferase class I/II-fold pyridoxal phosphate-dependent enzyme [Candidatus Latescibacterota bacterium]NIO28433.1 aminotransferase class I/II-fold pyridoxal phosphate-dependent enzyme [Candidatus Latescibacterota bacterium]NIO55982.1 aminotransferase class I/II-fold pyridoxal phosphate-dependent enzyme [Candidatus Latescibacterota bacterium]NIT01946.1 aminotransferase class I/II-fold pyridoxal phosphate-dependent enzyme [Candidatus Latescibacterota bacterium]
MVSEAERQELSPTSTSYLAKRVTVKVRKHVSLNLNVRGLEQSATLAINEKCRELRAQGQKIYNLGLGQSPFPVPSPVVAELKRHAHEKDYLPVKGLPALREAVAQYHRSQDQVAAQGDFVIVGPGSKELMFLLQLVFYGEIIVPTPSWVSYVPQARIIGRDVQLIHTTFEDKWRVTPERLEAYFESEHDDLRPRILILSYPGNPDGRSYSADELKEIAQIASRFEVILLSDEIYGRLHHEGQHVSVARYYPEGTIISSGLSKWCGAGGWRLGTFTFPPDLDWLMEVIASVASETYTSVSAPIQYAAVRAFKGGSAIDRYLIRARAILNALGRRCARIVLEAGIRVHEPVGAFYLFLDFTPFAEHFAERGIKNSTTLCEVLLEETGVAILPGQAFNRPPWELTARMAYVDFDGPKTLAASEDLPLDKRPSDEFIENFCGNVIEAAIIIGDWVSSQSAKRIGRTRLGEVMDRGMGNLRSFTGESHLS